jgi:hypothetical protein
MTGEPTDDWTRRLDEQLTRAASRALLDNLAATLKDMVADWRSDRPADFAELKHEFKTGIEEIRAAYRTNMKLVVLAMHEEMTATQLRAEHEYRALSQQALAGQPSAAKRSRAHGSRGERVT